MFAAALLLVVLGAVSPPPPVACDGISRRSFVDAIPTTMANEFGDPASQTSYQAFGVIIEMTAGTGTTAVMPERKCEGVLLSPKVALTALECRPVDKRATLYFKFLGDNIPVTYNNFKKAGRYFLIQLPRAPKKEPSVYPFLSWYARSETLDPRYGIREESVTERKIYVSSWLAHKSAGYKTEMTTINTALQNCEFDPKDRLIALQCRQLAVCKGKTVLSGSAYFTFTQTSTEKIVSVGGLVSLRSSGSFCKRTNAPNEPPSTEKTPKIPECNDAYVCGKRFTQKDVTDILTEARKLDMSGLTFHDDYIPSGTRIGSFNMQGLEKFSRPYAGAQAETVRNIIERAEILALQEVGTRLTNVASKEYAFFRDNIINFMPGRRLKAIDSFAFVYDSNKFTIVSCNLVKAGTIVSCSFKNNAVTTSSNTFTLYNVHLTNAFASTRYAELKQIQADIAALTANNKVVMIAGDFNIGAGKETQGGSQTKAFLDTRKAMRYLKDMQFPDPGMTTHREKIYVDTDDPPLKESHFDRFAVSKNVRLMYTYYPENTKDASKTAGTILDGRVGEETPAGLSIPFKPKRISTTEATCPPEYHNYAIEDQIDRLQYLNRELLACHSRARRQYMPKLYRSRELSDHLPVTFTHGSTKVKVATWNMRFFDPTIDPKSPLDSDDFKERKEITKADKFQTVLNKFDIVAVQELQAKSRPKNAENYAPGVAATTNLIMNKKWYWSESTPELGFAVKAGIYPRNCKDIDMTTAVDTGARSSFMCKFYTKTKNKAGMWVYTYKITLANAHVRNVDSSPATGEKYRKEAEKLIPKIQKKSAFLVGDFNAIFPNPRVKCTMAGYRSLSYTKYDKFTTLDYMWPLNGFPNRPGVTNCRVYNPEILRLRLDDLNSPFVFSDVKVTNRGVNPPAKTKVRMKTFPVWNSVSDHYPVYMKFFVPQ